MYFHGSFCVKSDQLSAALCTGGQWNFIPANSIRETLLSIDSIRSRLHEMLHILQ